MKCPRCQAQNYDGLKFCEDSGAGLQVICLAYVYANVLGSRFGNESFSWAFRTEEPLTEEEEAGRPAGTN